VKTKKEDDDVIQVVSGRQVSFFFLTTAKGSSLSSKLFLTLVVTKLSDLTRTSPGPCQCVPAVERAGFARWVACEDGVGVLRRHQDEI
jgi:hypothetical protein